MALKRVMVLTGGGDCPGLNAVIRGIVKRASQENDWEVVGCIESFNGVLREPTEIEILDENVSKVSRFKAALSSEQPTREVPLHGR